jgi:hypothetical protein
MVMIQKNIVPLSQTYDHKSTQGSTVVVITIFHSFHWVLAARLLTSKIFWTGSFVVSSGPLHLPSSCTAGMHDCSCRWTKLTVLETSAVTCYVFGVTLCSVFVDLSVSCWLSSVWREVMCEGVTIVTCGARGIGGSVVMQAVRTLFLVTKVIHTHMIMYFISYWVCVSCWGQVLYMEDEY